MNTDATPQLRVAFYGDDFTGSTDVLEALSLAGVPTALFLEPPTPDVLSQHPDLEAIGVAGLSRTMSPPEMTLHLLPVFEALRALDPDVVHYKICSTFDSSPTVGSIGRAIELGQDVFGEQMVPLVVGAPVLGRYCVFGNLFARSGGDSEVYRLDRHPTMSAHPSTPMNDADLLRHLARQTNLPMQLVDVLALDRPTGELEAVVAHGDQHKNRVVLFDTVTDAHLRTVGELIWKQAQIGAPVFVVGSSGVEYALTAHWQVAGPQTAVAAASTAASVDQVLVVSGSCSPVTARQIARAEHAGFASLALKPEQLLPPAGEELRVLEPTIAAARQQLKGGRSVIVHACAGPSDPRLAMVHQRNTDRLASDGDGSSLGQIIGIQLGSLLSQILEDVRLQRVVVTGGDTSGFVAQTLGINCLRFVAPIAPGSPLCKAEAAANAIDGREIVFKGGQVGKDDFFLRVLRGSP